MEENKSRVLIVDDHPMVREGLLLRINREKDLLVCCEASSADAALAASAKCKIDIALVDLNLGDSSGLFLIRQLRNRFPEMLILVVSMLDENFFADRAFQAGDQGYIMKQEAMETVVDAIRQVLDGQLYVSDKLRTQLVRQFMRTSLDKSGVSALSAIEFDVLTMLGMSLSNKQIGEKLSRSPKTIETHCASIKRKLGLGSGRELIQFAIDWSKSPSTSLSDIKI